MKNFALIIVMLSFGFRGEATAYATPKRSNALLRFIAAHEGIRDFGLFTLIARRCSRYMPFQEVIPCKVALRREIEILDFDLLINDPTKFARDNVNAAPEAYSFIAFKTNLLRLLADPKITVYLNDVQSGLNQYLQGSNDSFNLWSKTLSHFVTPIKTAEVLAALFQDISLLKLHIHYLDQTQHHGTAKFTENKLLLGRVIDTINLILDYSETRFPALFYPSALYNTLNRNIYHFYVPLYLSLALEKEGHSSTSSFAAPFLLNLTYEFISTADDYRYFLADPKTLDSRAHAWKIQDIYGGYCGPSFGLKKKIASMQLVKDTFAISSREAVRLLLGN